MFRTEIKLEKSDFRISHIDKLMFIGSCFTENIGKKLENFKFNIDINPFGILYNPISVKSGLDILLSGKDFTEKDIFYKNELWNSFYHHSRFSHFDKNIALDQINQRINQSKEFITTADYLFITFGTAWVYLYNKTNKIVSNCHKIPAKEFTRKRLSVHEIVHEYKLLIDKLITINQKLKIIFTVSPVRHWKDGAHGNQLSKATLLLTIDELCQKYDNIAYFPSYEMLMDDLRDYRFYNEDMLHPNDLAVKYIWTKFSDTYFNENTQKLIKHIEKINKAVQHRVINLKSEQYQKFLLSNIKQIKNLNILYPNINFNNELKYFESKLI